MVMPEMRRGERQNRNRQQNADEGQPPDETEMAAVDRRRIGAGGEGGHGRAQAEHEAEHEGECEDGHRGGSARCELLSGQGRDHTM